MEDLEVKETEVILTGKIYPPFLSLQGPPSKHTLFITFSMLVFFPWFMAADLMPFSFLF
jgi:hypothetical protein